MIENKRHNWRLMRSGGAMCLKCKKFATGAQAQQTKLRWEKCPALK